MDNLEELKKKLYQKDGGLGSRLDRESLKEDDNGSLAKNYWSSAEPKTIEAGSGSGIRGDWDPGLKRRNTLSSMKFFIFLFFFIVILAGGGAAYVLYSGGNIISSSNVSVEAAGPVYVDGGQEAKFNFTVKNQNGATLEVADLIFDFPANTFSSQGETMTRTRISLGKLEPGAVANKSLNLVFFGLENEEKKIQANLEYRFADSNAIFVKSKDHSVKISKAPVGLSVEVPKEAVSGQKIAVKVAVVSNSDAIAPDLKLELKYPPGFRFEESDPEPSKGNNLWNLGDFGSSQQRDIVIEGTIEGENSEERTFTATVGVMEEGGAMRPFGSASQKLAIKKSPLNLSVLINGSDEPEYEARAGESIRLDLNWVNNLSGNIRDAKVELELEGEALDERSFSVTKGTYLSQEDKIVWTPSSLKDLALISSGASGKSQMSFTIKRILPVSGEDDKNFAIKVNARITGTGTSDQYENKQITDNIGKEIKIGSRLQAVGKTLHYSGQFKNSGSVPPKVGEETSYTIVWSLAGNVNDLSDVKVSASLPPYVTKGEGVHPEGSDLQFDEKKATLVWNVGNVSAGTGLISPAKEIAFQVSITPNLAQVGTAPILVNGASVEGRDSFTGEAVRAQISELTASLSADPQAKGNDGKVVE
ncbi:hypothetical protein C4572_03435 [Candidatus Parcubacteria bacterium]|nr:MAG: hypothetical protein C4572_03435 [Candidatus Parcubacteria bacterium]